MWKHCFRQFHTHQILEVKNKNVSQQFIGTIYALEFLSVCSLPARHSMAHVHGSKIGTSFSVPKVNPATQNLRHNQWPHAKGYLDRSDALQCCDQRAKCEVELRHASWTASKHSEGQLWNAMDSFSKSRNRKSKRRHWTLAENWTWFSLFSLIFYCHYCVAVFVAIAVAVATAVAAAAAESKWCWLQLHCVFCNRCTIGWISPVSLLLCFSYFPSQIPRASPSACLPWCFDALFLSWCAMLLARIGTFQTINGNKSKKTRISWQ